MIEWKDMIHTYKFNDKLNIYEDIDDDDNIYQPYILDLVKEDDDTLVMEGRYVSVYETPLGITYLDVPKSTLGQAMLIIVDDAISLAREIECIKNDLIIRGLMKDGIFTKDEAIRISKANLEYLNDRLV